ncbi:hypothetical protein AD953_00605, partial [Acetobacter malorum]
AMVEQTTAASHNLTIETRTLAQTLSTFRIGETEHHSFGRPTEYTLTPLPSPQKLDVKPELSATMATTSSDEGWEEF